MKSLSLTHKLVKRLKVKHLTKSTLCPKYFRNIVIVLTKGKNMKIKINKIYLVLLPPLPSQDGGLLSSQLFSRQKFLKIF